VQSKITNVSSLFKTLKLKFGPKITEITKMPNAVKIIPLEFEIVRLI